MEYKYYGIYKRYFNKICTVLKYMSLEPPLDRAGFLGNNHFSCENAFNLLNTLLTQTEWVTNEDENLEIGLIEGDLMCKLSLDECELLTYIIKNFKEEEFSKEIAKCNSRTIHDFESNYEGGYFGEIYDRINIKCCGCGTEWEKNNKLEIDNNFILLLNFILKRCIIIERLKSYFVRNLFRATSRSKLFKISENEQKFLFYFFDCLHNIPEYIDKLLNLINGKQEDYFIFTIFERELTNLYGLLRLNPEYNFEIQENLQIKIWIHDLQPLVEYVSETCGLINQLKINKYI